MKRTIVVIAAFFAIGSSSFAAGRYLITSPSQIKPSVITAIAHRVASQIEIKPESWEPSGRVFSGPCQGVGALLTGGGFEWEGPGRFELTDSYPSNGEWVIEGRVYGQGKLRSDPDCIAPR
jgi:hypothetical protein